MYFSAYAHELQKSCDTFPPSPLPSPAQAGEGITPSPPETGERVGGVAGVSVGLPTACEAAVRCSGLRALQVRGMLTTGDVVDGKLLIEKRKRLSSKLLTPE